MAKKKKSVSLIQDGENLFKLGKVEEAIKCFDKEISINPTNTEAINNKGYCLLTLKKTDEAKLCFERSLKINDTKAENWAYLGTYYLSVQDIENAHQCFKKVEKLDGNELSHSQIAYYYYSTEEYEKSALYVEKTLSIDDKNVSALNTKGLLYVYHKKYEEAINLFEHLINIYDSNSMFYSNLGYTYLLVENIPKAEKNLNKSISLDHENAYAYNNMGLLYHKKSDFLGAWEFAELATLKNAEISEFWKNKAEILISLLKLGNEAKGGFKDVGYFLCRANLSTIDAIIDLNTTEILSKEEKDQIISGMIAVDAFYAETTRNCKVEKDIYSTIYQMSLEIVALLDASESVEFEFAHYTTQETANALIFNNSPFRLHSVTTANDPKEGNPLLNFLGFTGSFSPNIYQAFVGSFTFNLDSLNQFRLYGKDNNIEGTGVSLNLSFNYFGENANINHAIVRPTKPMSSVAKQPLFRCIYLDPLSKRVISLAHREACVFYRENTTKSKEVMDGEVNKYLGFINEQKIKVENALNQLNNEVSNAYNRINDEFDKRNEAIKIIPLLLIHLRYLVKHYDFKEEQECRIIQVEPLINNSNIIVTDDNSRMYVNYLPFHNDDKSYLNTIYWGPKTSNYELFKDRVTHLGMNIFCFKNEHPFI
ncbi:tetratricopeptide repeat protein [Pedobacter namyangjuensis]|uniref:tetratricopeptide repeat protein n=1 Tax=Pedobacter namyangjuensis TaxID=600626 RepID=UPI000DE4CA8C|nr:tetratricopeptide repeat protein [Pedobacter namyangjuensis]